MRIFTIGKAEVIEYKGFRYRRYPHSTSPSQRRYFSRNSRGKHIALHRVIWEEAHGKIPDGHDIHHKNGDTSDNRLENLECLSRAAHRSQHCVPDPTPQQLYKREWSRRNRAPRKKAEPTKKTCQQCGKDYETFQPKRSKFCSTACQQLSHQVGEQFRTCAVCGAAFTTRNATRTVCSEQCKIERNRAREAERHKSRYTPRASEHRKQCAQCGAEFVARSSSASLCSEACKQQRKLHNQRIRRGSV